MGGTTLGSEEALTFLNVGGDVEDFSMDDRLRSGRPDGASLKTAGASGKGKGKGVGIFGVMTSTAPDVDDWVKVAFCNEKQGKACCFISEEPVGDVCFSHFVLEVDRISDWDSLAS